MKRWYDWKVFAVFLVALVCVCVIVINPIKTGLDISGGTHFTIKVHTKGFTDSKKQDALDQSLAVFRNRVNEFGLSGTLVQQSGEDRIVVQVPGSDVEDARRIRDALTRPARLEFRVVIKGPEELS